METKEYTNKIIKVTKGKSGVSNGRHWQLYVIYYEGPRGEEWKINTFSRSTAEKASRFKGKELVLAITTTEKGNRLEYVREQNEPIPTQPSSSLGKQSSPSQALASGPVVNAEIRVVALESAISIVQTLLKVAQIKKTETAISKINELREDNFKWLSGSMVEQAKEVLEKDLDTEEIEPGQKELAPGLPDDDIPGMEDEPW